MAVAAMPNSASMTVDFPRRFPWSMLLSVAVHGVAVAALLYTSVYQVVELPAPAQPITVTIVAPEVLEPPQAAPQPVVEPEPVPEPPKEATVVIHKPEQKPKPKPKPKTIKEEPKRDVRPAEPRPAAPVENTVQARPSTSPTPMTSKPVASAPTGPRALSRNQPQYPTRAQMLRIEGRVRVKFDVTADGRVENVEVLSAQPANIFEREVKAAMRKWRYESGKPGNGIIVNVLFRLRGGAQME